MKLSRSEVTERVVSAWAWRLYDDHGPWDEALGDPAPTHGWRRVVELQVGPASLIVTEWHFGRIGPPDASLAAPGREVHVVRVPTKATGDSAA